MALKLPKQYHPDFSRPGVKPTGAVEIDWSNPLARGLKVCLIGNSQRATNLANQANPLTINGNVTHNARDGFVFGDTVSDYISDASTDYAQTGKFSAFLVVKPELSSGSLPTFIARGDASVGEWMLRHNNSGAVRFFANGGTWNTTSANLLSYGIKQTVGFSADTGSGLSVYVNGAVANTAGGSFLNTSTKPLTVGAADGDSNRPYAGSMNFILIYERLLSSQEHAELNRDPYQILKPAQPMMLFTSAGGGGGTYTVTGSLSAVLQKQGIARQATLNAILQKQGLTLNSSVDALLQKSVDITGEIDAILKKLGITSVSSIDALLQKRGSVSSSLDAILTALTAGETTVSIDAILKKLGITNTASLDSVLQKQGVNVSASLSALLQKAVSLSSVMDAILQKTVTTGASLDAILIAIGSGSLSANFDAILLKTLAVNLSIDALLQKKDLTVYASIDALLSKRQTTAATLDAILYGSASIAASLDALLKRTGVTITANLDAILTLSGSFITPKNLIYVMAEDRIVTVLAEDRTVKVI